MTFPSNQLPPDVIKALEQGRKIDAIKRLRAATGLGLAEAKALVETHLRGRQGPSTFPDSHVNHPTDAMGVHVFTPPPAGPTRAVEQSVQPRSGLGPGEVQQSYTAAWVVAILVAVLVTYYYFFAGS